MGKRGRHIANLLIVDDNPEHLNLMAEILNDEKQYNILKASSGSEALDIIDRQEIHIVLLDVVLQDMDGYEVCRLIRNNLKSYPAQIILISGFEKSKDLDDLLETGADDFVSKPISPLELNTRIKAAIIRWRNQLRAISERRDDNLSSLISENIYLRSEFDKARNLNQELEKSNQELKKLASFDPLSGLLNRRTLFQRIDVEIERSQRLEVPMTGIMIDIDHFKRINDNYGHPCGDMVIKEIGNKLNNSLRKYDYAGRYGGEEFFVIFTNTTSETAFTIAERFRREMEEDVLTCSGMSFSVTVSIGIGQYNQGEPPGKWISRADSAMYRAKQAGRNMVALE